MDGALLCKVETETGFDSRQKNLWASKSKKVSTLTLSICFTLTAPDQS